MLRNTPVIVALSADVEVVLLRNGAAVLELAELMRVELTTPVANVVELSIGPMLELNVKVAASLGSSPVLDCSPLPVAVLLPVAVTPSSLMLGCNVEPGLLDNEEPEEFDDTPVELAKMMLVELPDNEVVSLTGIYGSVVTTVVIFVTVVVF